MPNDLSTAQRIFNVRYLIKVPAYALSSTPMSELMGVPVSDDPGMAEVEATLDTPVNYPIARIAILRSQGVPICFINPKDTLTIHTAISDHLYAWRKAAIEDMHVLVVPVEELRILDELATAVYPIARQWMAVDIKDNVNSNDFVNFINTRTNASTDTEQRIESLPAEHKSEVDDLAKVATRRSRRRRR